MIGWIPIWRKTTARSETQRRKVLTAAGVVRIAGWVGSQVAEGCHVARRILCRWQNWVRESSLSPIFECRVLLRLTLAVRFLA
jgi:hypothetical protein